MRQPAILCAIYLSIALQSSTLMTELPLQYRPFLPAIALVMIGIWVEGSLAILWSGCLGLLLDGMSSERMGLQLSLCALLACGLQLTHPRRRCVNVVSAMVIVFVLAFIWRTGSPLLIASLDGNRVDVLTVVVASVVEASVTAGFAGGLLLVTWLIPGRPDGERLGDGSRNRRWLAALE